jgi:hypothetical protein
MLAQPSDQIGEQHMPGQALPQIGQGGRGRKFEVEAELEQVPQFLVDRLLFNLAVVVIVGQEGQGDLLRVTHFLNSTAAAS